MRRSICSSSEEEEEVSGAALLVEEGAAVVEVAGTKAREGSVAEDWEEEARDGSPSMEDDIVEVLDGYLWESGRNVFVPVSSNPVVLNRNVLE